MADKAEVKPPEIDYDVVTYCGGIDRNGYDLVSDVCATATSTKCLLILTTFGGDPHAGYRIARALRHHFKDGLAIFIPHYCKSAGTLISIAADELIIADRGELGPLDVQVKKSDEIFEQASGLDIPEALNYLQANIATAVQSTLVNIRMRTGLGTKMAANMAGDIVSSLFGEIFAQIDPLKIGELQRAIRIALEYGERLNAYRRNLKPGALVKLVASYPSHGFVIDRKEAGDLFERVRAPNSTENHLWSIIRDHMTNLQAQNVQLVPCETVKKALAAQQEPSNAKSDPSVSDGQQAGKAPEPAAGDAAGNGERTPPSDGDRKSNGRRSKAQPPVAGSDEQSG